MRKVSTEESMIQKQLRQKDERISELEQGMKNYQEICERLESRLAIKSEMVTIQKREIESLAKQNVELIESLSDTQAKLAEAEKLNETIARNYEAATSVFLHVKEKLSIAIDKLKELERKYDDDIEIANKEKRRVATDREIVKRKLTIAINAMKAAVGFEPFDHSLEPRPLSEALAKIEGES